MAPLMKTFGLDRLSLEDRLRLVEELYDSLDGDSVERVAVRQFQAGRITHHELSCITGLDRHETDALLKRSGIYEGSTTDADVDADIATLDKLLGSR